MLVISERHGKKVVARRTGEERREGKAAGKAGDLGFVVAAHNLGSGVFFCFVLSTVHMGWDP